MTPYSVFAWRAPSLNPQIRIAVKTCPNLPSMPSVAMRVVEMAQSDDVDLNELSDLIATDPALATKILKTVNSPFYGLGKGVSTISQALVVLGLQAVKTLVLGFSLVRSMRRQEANDPGFDYETYWRHSIYAAVAARQIGREIQMKEREEAFLAALLQDVGMPVLHAALGGQYDQVLAEAGPSHQALTKVEHRKIDTTHPEVASLLLDAWQLPAILSNPITHHHNPDAAPDNAKQLTRVVHLGGLIGETFLDHVTPDMIQAAVEQAESSFGMTEAKVKALMDKIGEGTRNVAKLFEVQLGEQRNYDAIMARANEALMTLSLQSQAQATKAETRAKEFEHQANTDGLTQVANRKKFGTELKHAFSRARRVNRPLSMIIIDADHFKNVNDTHGHDAGDTTLVYFAQTLQEVARKGDLVARFGGEEFVVILPETDAETAASLGESIRAAVEAEPVEYEGQMIPVTTSVGVATFAPEQPYENAKAFFKAADAALYVAKANGRNRVEIAALAAQAA